MPRYLNVAERAMRALEGRLATITRENGYNTSVQRIERLRQTPQSPPNPSSIFVVPQQEEIIPWCNDREYERRTVQIWFCADRAENMDTEYELFKSDILRCLMTDIPDPSHPIPHLAMIYCEFQRAVPLFMEESEPFTMGMIEYLITYAYTIDDDRLWDSCEDILVEVQE